MIKIFRKIRQRLLSENKFNNYILYAFGEIMLVVLGILIALAINDWRQNENNETLRKEYLLSLKNDFQTDIKNIERNKNVTDNNMIKSLTRAVEVFLINDPNNVDTLQLINDIEKAILLNITPIRRGTYQELMSTGSMNLIKNTEIKNALHDYYERVTYYDNYYATMLSGKNRAIEILGRSYPFRYNQNRQNFLDKFEFSDKPIDFETLLNNTELENVLLSELFVSKWITRSFNTMLSLAKKIEALLEAELNK